MGGGVKTEEGPGVINGCFATCSALITTACELWYLIYDCWSSLAERYLLFHNYKVKVKEREKQKWFVIFGNSMGYFLFNVMLSWVNKQNVDSDKLYKNNC